MCVPKCLYNTREHKGQHEFFQKVFCRSMMNGDVEEGWTIFFLAHLKRDFSIIVRVLVCMQELLLKEPFAKIHIVTVV